MATQRGCEMKSDQQNAKANNNNNLILFPSTIQRHLDQAIEASNLKQYSEAVHHFEQVLRYEPNHTSAKMGLAVTWIEMNRFREAIELTDQMLKDRSGDYYYILRIHLAALLKSEQYGRLNNILNETLKQPNTPPDIRSECESLLEAIGIGNESDSDLWEVEADDFPIDTYAKENTHLLENWIDQLYNGKVQDQFIALERLQLYDDSQAVKAVLNWLGVEEQDPLLKTLALQTLRKMGVEGEVIFTKRGKNYEVDLQQLPIHFADFPEFINKITHLIKEETYHIDPVLESFSTQLWMEYLYIVYPEIPTGKDERVWAAALHSIAESHLYNTGELLQVSEQYQVEQSQVKKVMRQIEDALSSRNITN
jgi:tetratricopeptide (TPR) repeat protein